MLTQPSGLPFSYSSSVASISWVCEPMENQNSGEALASG